MFFKLFLAVCVLFVAGVACESEPVAPDESQETCRTKSDLYTLLVVGSFSSFVFCFIGILPAFFIRTDADEERFSKWKGRVNMILFWKTYSRLF